jgi:hypothetical protein
VWYLAWGIALKAGLTVGLMLWPADPAPVAVPPREVAVRCETHPAPGSASVVGEAAGQVECVEVDPAPSDHA